MLGAACVTLLLMSSACSDSENIAKNASRGPEVMKTWMGDCKESILPNMSVREYYQLDGATVTRINEFFSENDCKQAAALVKYSGDFIIQSNVANIADAKQVDFLYVKVTVTAVSDEGQKFLEAVNYCGRKEWPIQQEFDLTDHSDDALCTLDDTPYASYDIFLVSNDKMRLGKAEGDKDKKKPEARPSLIDDSVVYEKSDRTFSVP